MYDAELGRFVSRDPIGYYGGSGNLYRYVANSPLAWRDPMGLWMTGDTIPGISFGPDVNMEPDIPESSCAGTFTCPGGFVKYVERHDDIHVKWITVAHKHDTITGYYDGLLGDTFYVYQGTFTLQRELRHRKTVVSCKRYFILRNPQACSYDSFVQLGGTGCENGKYYLAKSQVVFTGKRYSGDTTVDPSDVANLVGIALTIAGAVW